MPIVPGASPDQLGPIARAPDQPPAADSPGALDVAAAAARTSNLAGTLYDRMTAPKPDAKAQPGFDPIAHIPEGYEPFGDRFLDAESPEQIAWTKQRIDSELRDRSVMARAGKYGMAASFAAGLTDPLTLASMALPATGATRLAQAGRLALINAGTSAAQEAAMHELTVLRTPQESAFNIAGSAVLGGVFGALMRPHIPTKVADELGEDLSHELHSENGGERVLGPDRPRVFDAGVPALQGEAAAGEPGARWHHDKGAQPGEPRYMLDVAGGDPESARAAITERKDASGRSSWESLLPGGQSVGHFNSPAEAAQAAEYIADRLHAEPESLQAETPLGEVKPETVPPLEGAGKRPPLRQGEDTAEALFQEQVAREAAAAHGDTELTGKFRGELEADYEGAKERYAALDNPKIADTQGGRILNVDMARELSPEYVEARNRSAEVHEPASEFIKRLYAEKLAEPAPAGKAPVVMFTAGGTGAGKTSAIETTLKGAADRAQIVYDTNMNTLGSAKRKIEQALEAGKDVHIAYIYRHPEEALREGALPRAMRMGRTVPVEEHAKTHSGSFDVMQKLQELYKGDKRVSFSMVDNSFGKGHAQLSTLEKIGKKPHNVSAEELRNAVEEEYKAGRISEPVREGTIGGGAAADRRIPAGDRAGVGGEPQPQRGERERAPAAPSGSERVATATGRQIEVRSRVVEAADLVTSDHPKYPQELQPRQRGNRAALTEQVRSIARNLNPELLGRSAEADRGAPITGSGNVVESGNGRVQALREVYAKDPEKAKAYREFLEREGFNTEGMKEPVMVRERQTELTPEERRAFTVEANQSSTAALSPVERAQADARLLDAETLSQMRGGEIAGSGNAGFVRAFISKLPEAERNALANPDGSLSQEGVRRIQAAVLAKAFGGTRESNATLGRMLESTDSDMRSTLGALLDAAPAFARLRLAIEEGKVSPKYDLSQAIVQAIENVAKLRASGQSLNDFLKQADFLTHRPPIVDTIMRALYDAKGERLAGRETVAERLVKYAGQATRQRLDQASLFAQRELEPAELLAGKEKERSTVVPAADMFGLRTPQTPRKLEPVPQDLGTVNPNAESTAGAAAVVQPGMKDERLARGARTLAEGPIGRVAPGLRVLTSASLAARRLVQEMVNIPELLEKNLQRVATAQPVERKLWGYEGKWWQAWKARGDLFREYRERMAGLNQEALSRRDFNQEIAFAMRRGDKSAIPEAAKAAAQTRAIVFEPLYQRALKAGMVPEDAKLYADSYLTRQYDLVKIRQNLGRFTDLVTQHFVNQGVDRAEARDLAGVVRRNILGSERGTMDWHYMDGIVPESGQLKARTLTAPDEVLEPFLNSDIDHLSHSYLRSMAPEVEFTERFGSRDMKDQLSDVADDYERMIERARARGEDPAALEKEYEKVRQDLEGMRDRLYGIKGQPKDPGSFPVRAGRVLRADNALRLLGAATLAHFPDIANVIMRYGMPQTFSAIAKVLSSPEAMKLSSAEAKRMGAALDMVMNLTSSILGDYGTHSQYAEQRVMARLTRAFTIGTGETPLITAVQSLTSTLASDTILRAAEKVAAGKTISQRLAQNLAGAGLDEAMLRRIAAEGAANTHEVNGLRFGMSDLWKDKAAADAFESAVLRDAHGVTLRPGAGDTPFFMSTELGKTLLQFKSFAFASSRIVVNPLLQGLARGDLNAIQGLFALAVMGTASYVAKQKAAGQPLELNNPKRLALEVLDKSNLLGWTSELVFPALWQFGMKDLSRWSDRDAMETLLGPSAGTVGSLYERRLASRRMAGEDEEDTEHKPFSRSDEHFLRRLMPGQNLWYFRRAINALEDAVGDTFDLPGKSQKERAEILASNQ